MTGMKRIPIKGLPRPLSSLTLGTMHMSPETQAESNALLDAYVAAGGDTLDTAQIYGAGKSEQAIGAWMGRMNNREKVVIITKGVHPVGGGEPRVTPEAIHSDLGGSLKRLGTKYIDLYLLHRDDPSVRVAPIIDALNEEYKAGRIRAFGASNWTTERIEEANDYALRMGLQGFCLSSIHLSLVEPREQIWPGCLHMDAAAKSYHEFHSLPLLAWSSQARGLFSKRYESGAPFSADLDRIYGTIANLGRIARARDLAREKGATANRVALAWVLARPYPVSAVIGPRNPAQLEDSLKALELQLTQKEVDWLERG
jgi:aryl-alcohol dehydrogenase-like predicted oxidoreductase